MMQRGRVTSGITRLDSLLGGLSIGDNVVWHDDSGSLAYAFCLNFLRASREQDKPIIYVSFDRSIKNLLEKLGPLADHPNLTVLDCFTCGKGGSSPVFLKSYDDWAVQRRCRIVRVEEPRHIHRVTDQLYELHGAMQGDVRFVFESLTGMQELWGGEEHLLNFYSHSCPHLYELNTVAYWIMEKRAHSPRLRAQISQIAQVVIDLGIKRGTTSLTILKAEQRDLENLHKPYTYWVKDHTVSFDEEGRPSAGVELGARLKALRNKQGLSQTELARLVGVTPSTISQVESNLIYPSLPALLKMAEILSVDVGSLLQTKPGPKKRGVFPGTDAIPMRVQDLPEESISVKLLTPVDFDAKAEPCLIEIQAQQTLPSHFFVHKGEELGYLLSGKLQVKIDQTVQTLRAGDLVYLTTEFPSQWKNPGSTPARLLWIKIR